MMPTRERVRVGAFLRTLLPSIRDYRDVPRTWRGDLVGGVTVGIVALPLALGFGVSSGVGAEAGLITAIVAGLIAAIFGGSNVQVSGPTGAMVVVLLPIVAMHGVAMSIGGTDPLNIEYLRKVKSWLTASIRCGYPTTCVGRATTTTVCTTSTRCRTPRRQPVIWSPGSSRFRTCWVGAW